MAGVQNRDISKEIANETDPIKREELLKERQEYIDEHGLEGTVPSNELVSTWTSDYMPGSWNSSEQKYDKIVKTEEKVSYDENEREDVTSIFLDNEQNEYEDSKMSAVLENVQKMFSDLQNMQTKALEEARDANRERLDSSLANAHIEFDELKSNAQVNARLTALGNEEKLAALGLSTGGHNEASSGYAESSRIAMDNALKSNLTNIDLGRAETVTELKNASYEIDSALSQESIQNMSNLAIQNAQLMYDFYSDENAYVLEKAKLTGFIDGDETLDKQEYDYNQNIFNYQIQADNYQKTLDEYSQALQRWEIFGEVLPADSAILGVEAGTKTADRQYDDARLKIDNMKLYL